MQRIDSLTLENLIYKLGSGQYFSAWTFIKKKLPLDWDPQRRRALRFSLCYNDKAHTKNDLLPFSRGLERILHIFDCQGLTA